MTTHYLFPRPLRVVDLFAGLEGWSAAFRDRGHDVFSTDIDPRFDVTLTADIRRLTLRDFPWQPDIVLASPPCDAFSVLNIGKNWTHDHYPKTDAARLGLTLLRRTISLIGELQPRYAIIENPRAKMRRIIEAEYPTWERRTVTYCQLGMQRMKPTDLFGGFPPSLALPAPCRNGDTCHVSAPRGSTTGTQGDPDRAAKAEIPYALSLLVAMAAEQDVPR